MLLLLRYEQKNRLTVEIAPLVILRCCTSYSNLQHALGSIRYDKEKTCLHARAVMFLHVVALPIVYIVIPCNSQHAPPSSLRYEHDNVLT